MTWETLCGCLLRQTEGVGHYMRDFEGGKLAGGLTMPGSRPIPPTSPVRDVGTCYDYSGISCPGARAHGFAPLEQGLPAYAQMRDPDGDGWCARGELTGRSLHAHPQSVLQTLRPTIK